MYIFHSQGNLHRHIFDECDFIGCPLATIILVKSQRTNHLATQCDRRNQRSMSYTVCRSVLYKYLPPCYSLIDFGQVFVIERYYSRLRALIERRNRAQCGPRLLLTYVISPGFLRCFQTRFELRKRLGVVDGNSQLISHTLKYPYIFPAERPSLGIL